MYFVSECQRTDFKKFKYSSLHNHNLIRIYRIKKKHFFASIFIYILLNMSRFSNSSQLGTCFSAYLALEQYIVKFNIFKSHLYLFKKTSRSFILITYIPEFEYLILFAKKVYSPTQLTALNLIGYKKFFGCSIFFFYQFDKNL